MLHAVEEVGVAEREVAGTHLDETLDVAQEDVLVHDPDAPVVDRGHRAVAAAVHAAVARLDVADQPLLVAEHEAGVALQRREELARGKLEALAAEMHDLGSRRIASLGPREAADPGDQGGLVLARDHAVDQPPDREVTADGRVEAVETEGELGPLRPQRPGGPPREAHRGVHRDREGDRLAPLQPLRIPALDCEVEAADLVAGAAQGGGRRGDVQGLVPELVRRDQYDTHRLRLAARGRRQWPAAAAGARMSTSRRA